MVFAVDLVKVFKSYHARSLRSLRGAEVAEKNLKPWFLLSPQL
jgi:hypothetical protein